MIEAARRLAHNQPADIVSGWIRASVIDEKQRMTICTDLCQELPFGYGEINKQVMTQAINELYNRLSESTKRKPIAEPISRWPFVES
jgi:hypothetical protein